MKNFLSMVLIVILAAACNTATPPQKIQKFKDDARKQSVQVTFQHAFLYAVHVPDEVDEPDIKDVITEEIKKAIEEERLLQEEKADAEKLSYKSHLTSITVYGHEPTSRTHVPIGALSGVPSWAKFPENVLTVYKVEKKEIKEWEAEYEKDVLTISETANVSPANAKEILRKLRQDGYSVSKDEISVDEEIELLYFSTWSDPYPSTLKWSVKVSGTDENLIIGYDPRGIIEVKPIPEDKRVDVEVSYFDLEDYSKPKSTEMQSLEASIAAKDELINDLYKQMDDMVEIPEIKYDITKATMYDVFNGTVKIYQGWTVGGGSGVYLGNMNIPKDAANSTSQNRYYHSKFAETPMNGVVLTNAHVAAAGITLKAMVSEDGEEMFIIFPGVPYVRYTHSSDRMGTPAAVLWYDGEPVMSAGVDAALLVTTPLPGYETNAAVLGNSDLVLDGQKVISVGNPGMLHKFTTEGVISNKNYNLFQSMMGDWIPGSAYDSVINDSMWVDTPIGMGGQSGSGVWALDGENAGKVIALRNAGLNRRYSDYLVSELTEVDSNEIDISRYQMIMDLKYEDIEKVFGSYADARYTRGIDQIDGFVEAVKNTGGYVPISGMNLCIPINKIKEWLVERGIDLGFKLDSKYWIN